MQIVGTVLRIWERPISLGTPPVNAHDKNHDWRLLHAVVHLLQPAVEPAEVQSGEVNRIAARSRAELALWEAAAEVHVAPGADDQALVAACVVGGSPLAHAPIVLQCAP